MQISNNKNKTNKEWYIEWFKAAIFLAVMIIGIFASQHFLVGIAMVAISGVLYIATFVSGLIFIARTIGVVMTVVFPEKKASGISFDKDNINILYPDGKTDLYPWSTVNSITLSENYDGIFIDSNKGKQSYDLPDNYKVTEGKIDAVLLENASIGLKKEKQWVESNQAGLDPTKDFTGVKRTYTQTTSFSGQFSPLGGHAPGREVTIDSEHGVEAVYYSRQ